MATKSGGHTAVAVAEGLARCAVFDPAPTRGPLRPAQLVSARERESRRLGGHMFILGDVVLVSVLTIITLEIGFGTSLFHTTLSQLLPLALGAAALSRLTRGMGLYAFPRRERCLEHVAECGSATVIAFGVALVARIIVPDSGPSIKACAVWALMCAIGLMSLHTTYWLFVRRWRAAGWLTPNLVVVGATSHAEDLIRDAMVDRDMHVLGIFDDRRERSPLAVLGVPILGDTHDLLNHRITPFVDLIVIAVDPMATSRVREIASRLSVLPNRVTLLFDHANPIDRAADLAQLADAPLISPTRAGEQRRAFSKRIQDLAIGIPALMLFAPIMALVALAVRLDSKGPVFFRQRRHGFNNEAISVWKFRTMRHATADAKAERQVAKNDDRVTRVGRILRTSSLDELPQLFNVVRGEMSLVGPRPHAIGMKSGDVESSLLVAEYAHRHRIKPGITGWAAVNGSRGALETATAVSRRVELDIEYIDRQSFWLDLKIIALTVPRMLGDSESIR